MINEPKGVMVYARHARAATYCMPGMDRVLKRLGVNVDDFMVNGICVDDLPETENPLVRKVVAIATAEWARTHPEWPKS